MRTLKTLGALSALLLFTSCGKDEDSAVGSSSISGVAAVVSEHVVTVATVTWSTDVASAGYVEFGEGGELTHTTNTTASGTSHSVPLVGVPGFLKGMAEGELPSNPMGEKEAVSMSEFIPDSAINPHPRFGALTANIRRRRGGKVSITMPLLDDEATAATAAEAGAGMPNVEVHKDPLCELLK